MISLELAKKLKNAGLRWVPKRGDWCYFEDVGLIQPLLVTSYKAKHWLNDEDDIIWLPRLDQLLAEIEKRGYYPHIAKMPTGECISSPYRVDENGYYYEVVAAERKADTPEDAAGQALLWILERERQP